VAHAGLKGLKAIAIIVAIIIGVIILIFIFSILNKIFISNRPKTDLNQMTNPV